MAAVPAALEERILEAVKREAGSGKREPTSELAELPASRCSLPELLQRAGDRLLAEAIAAPASRDHALTLLAADALMTYAMEAGAGGEAPALPASRFPLLDD